MDPITASVITILGIPALVFAGVVIAWRNRHQITLKNLELQKTMVELEGQKEKLAILQEENKKYDRILSDASQPDRT